MKAFSNIDPSAGPRQATDAPSNRGEPGRRLVVECGETLSASVIWKWQRDWFEQASLSVWTDDVVPHHVNTNAYCARRYARIAVAWVRSLDMHPRGLWVPGQTPLTVLELGAGNGLFAHRFIREFRRHLGSERASPRLRYVLSDISEDRISTLAKVPALRTAHVNGELEFRCYAVAEGAGPPVDGVDGLPLLTIANYLFDGLPADAYEVRGGRVFRLSPRISLPVDEAARSAPMDHFDLSWDSEHVEPGGGELGRLLRGYLTAGREGYATIPRGAIACLKACLQTGCVELLTLAADRGTSLDEPLCSQPPSVARHGSFSIDVNFDAIASWFDIRRGHAMTTRSGRSDHVNFFGLLGSSLEERPLLKDAWLQSFDEFGMDDYLALKNAAIAQPAEDPWALLAFLRLSGCDERLFLSLLPMLVHHLRESDDGALRTAATRLAEEVRANALPDPHGLVDFGLGRVLAALEVWEGAAEACRAALACKHDEMVERFLQLCQSMIADPSGE
ncbi:hypothetical protein KYC5002_26980 [Archangium violaceum]|uniref:SAM-dependent methyltransferase n=1 Tax=Archangium violaceum TaxID=83451 RepID=UPI002B2DEA64|nr:hypothetical protein KYC5002_26980 [Archangium gephyra]